MDRSEVLILIKPVYRKNRDGIQKQLREIRHSIYCNVSSISGTEWLEAGRSGIKPEFRFTIFEPDYDGETIYEYQGRRYAIYRLYRGRNETLELYVMQKGGVQPLDEDRSSVYDL